MSYQALARKLRPQSFSELVGQDAAVRALRHALDNDRIHHAYLFTGTRGVGKTTIARLLAKSLNCEKGVSSSPCGECSACEEIVANRFVDLIEVDAASRTRVDDTRELLDNAQYLPSRGRFKVYLIDEVHMLSASSFNALLKTLEEPPAHVKFLLATTDPKKVPMTVLSRCLQFQLRNLSSAAIVGYLSDVLGQEAIDCEDSALEILARAARGSMRDALSLVDQAIAHGEGRVSAASVTAMLGLAGRNEIDGLLSVIASGNAADTLAYSQDLATRGVDFEQILQELVAAFHDRAVRLAVEGAGESDEAFSADELQLYYQIALLGLRDLAITPDPQTGFEMTLLRLLAFSPEPTRVPRREGAPPVGADDAAQTGETADTRAPEVRPVSSELSSTSARADATPGPRPAASGANAEWHGLQPRLGLSGSLQVIAQRTVLVTQTDTHMELVLDAAHDTLLNDNHAAGLGRAVSEALGTSVDVSIRVGEPAEETPADAADRLRRERQLEAEARVREDATVQSLLKEFDGRIQAVVPIDDTP